MKLYSAFYREFHPLNTFFPEYQCKVVNTPDDLDGPGILILHGGSDIHPSLYNKGRSHMSGAFDKPTPRDKAEWALMQKAKEKGIFIFGICRGAQMLCAFAGGFLIQHVDNHAGDDHLMSTSSNTTHWINSFHHQMVYPFDIKHELLGWSFANRSSRYFDEDNLIELPCEPEAVYYPEVRGFGVQWHPEWMEANCSGSEWIKEIIDAKL